jgi:hypothetical protein
MAGEISRRLTQIEKATDPNKLAKEAFNVFKNATPIAATNGGNARANTKLKGDEIHANYPYAAILDKGRHMTSSGARGSYQAPKGMTEPTLKFVQNYIKKEFKG